MEKADTDLSTTPQHYHDLKNQAQEALWVPNQRGTAKRCLEELFSTFGEACDGYVVWMQGYYLEARENNVPAAQQMYTKSYPKLLEMNDPEVFSALGSLYQFGDGGVDKDFSKAFECFQKDTERPFTQCLLGGLYQNGEGVSPSTEKALELFLKASEQDYAVAHNLLGSMYRDGYGGVEVDLDKAMSYLMKGARLGHGDAMVGVGYLHGRGLGVPKDPTKALEYYRLAAQQDNAIAYFNMGLYYQRGLSVDEDVHQASKYYARAAALGDEDAKRKMVELVTVACPLKEELDQ